MHGSFASLVQRAMLIAMSASPALIGASEAASLLGRDKTTAIRWGHDGTLRIAHKLPGKNGAILFARKDVLALAAHLAKLAVLGATG